MDYQRTDGLHTKISKTFRGGEPHKQGKVFWWEVARGAFRGVAFRIIRSDYGFDDQRRLQVSGKRGLIMIPNFFGMGEDWE